MGMGDVLEHAIRAAWIREAEEAIPDPPYSGFVDYESWSRAFRLREALISRLLAERLREPIHRVDAPPIPDAVPVNESVRAAWAEFHSSLRPPRGRSSPMHVRTRRQPMHTLVADPDFRHLSPE